MVSAVKLLVVAALLLVALPSVAQKTTQPSGNFKVLFVVPQGVLDADPFWTSVEEFATDVASDLGIELEVLHSHSRFQHTKYFERLRSSPGKPQYSIFQYEPEITENLLKLSKQAGIKAITFNSEIPDRDRDQIKGPRLQPHWLAHWTPDNSMAGEQLISSIVKSARTHIPSRNLSAIAIGGMKEWDLDKNRRQGLNNYLSQNPDIVLERYLSTTRWLTEEAERITSAMLTRYPDLDLIWTAADRLACGATTAIKAKGLVPGKDIFVGSMDWTERGIKAVQDGELEVLLGGHYMMVGWALLLIYDYHYGLDFKDDLGVEIKAPMIALNKNNVNAIYQFQLNDKWKTIDFKKFSKFENPQLDRYDFSLQKILKEAGIE